jgi:hypothetical protein
MEFDELEFEQRDGWQSVNRQIFFTGEAVFEGI